MTTAQFFEKFDLIAEAPDAVAKMRELVLHLAVQGRLVENSPGNPTTAEEIAADKVRLLRDLRIRSHPETPQPTKDDLPFPMPQSWHAVSLGDLAFSCPTSYGEDPVPSLVKAGVVKVGNIDNQGGFKGNFTERGFLAEEFESLVARQGDLMVVKSSGSAENVHSGKAALCTAEHDGKIVGTNFVLRLRPLGTPAMPEYIWRVLTSRYSRAWIEGTVQTMTYPNLKWSDFARLPIPLPPIAEQKRIVAKVDELMALCDQLEAQQQERETKHTALAQATLARFAEAPTPTNLNLLFHSSFSIQPSDLRKTILTLAVQGKLLPQDQKDGTASEMMASEAKLPEGHVRRRKIMKRAPIAANADQFFALPPSWEYATIQTLYDLNIILDYADGNHGSLYPRSSEFGDSGVMFVTARDISKGRVSWESCARLNEKRAHQLTKGWAQGGDVLLTHNATVGRVARVEPKIGTFLLGTSVTFYRLNEAFIDSGYFYYVLCSPTWKRQLEAIMEQTTRNQVSIQKQAYFKVPLPPLAEQKRIVAKVEELMALVNALEAQQAAADQAATHLLDAVVSELAAAA